MNNIILRGLNLFTANDKRISKTDIRSFEKYYQTTVPDLYSLFLNSFKIGRGLMKSNATVHHPSTAGKLSVFELKYSGKYSDYIGLYNLFSISESIEAMKNAYNSDDEIHKMGYAIIGECISNISLLLGIGEHNKNKIFLEDSCVFPNGERIVLISENIFEFANNLAICEKEKIGYGIKGYEQLYKNWGEDFWRIRNNEESL